MTLNPSEIILTVVNFLLLLFFLNKFLFKPYFALMDSREEKNRQALREQGEAKARIDENGRRLKTLEEEHLQAAENEAVSLRSKLNEASKQELSRHIAQGALRREESRQQRQAEERELVERTEEKLPQLSEALLRGLLNAHEKEA